MNVSEMNTQNIPNLHGCSLYKINSKRINVDKTLLYFCSMDKSKAKNIIVNACSTDEKKSKTIYIIVNTSKVKDAINETKNEETLVTDNSVINDPIYFKLFECGKNFMKNIDAEYEQLCMENLLGKWDTENLRYGQA